MCVLFGFQQCGEREREEAHSKPDVEINDWKKVVFHCLRTPNAHQ